MWIVVCFEDDQDVAVVPLSWYANGKCRWPDRKEREQLRTLVENRVEPKDSWLTYKARTVGDRFYDNLLKARQKCVLAENTSDLTSDPEKGKGKRKICRVQWSSESEEENGTCIKVSKGFPMPPTLGEITGARASPKAVSNSQSSSAASSSDDLLREDGRKSRFEEEVLRSLAFIKHSMIDISKRLRALERPVSASNDIAMEIETSILGSYPIDTQGKLVEEEKKLQDGLYRKQLVLELKMIGGNSPKDMTRRVLRALLTDAVAAEYSWIGFKRKKVFSKLILKDVLFDAVRKSKWSGTTDKELEIYTKDWLRHAKFRAGGSEKSVADGNSSS